MLNNSIFSKQDAKLLRHKNRQKILTPPTEKTPPYRYRDSAATHRKHIPKRGQGSTICSREGANTSTCTTLAGVKSKAGEMRVGGGMGGRGAGSKCTARAGIKGLAATGGQGLMGLAKELRNRCEELKRRQGERLPK